MYSTMNTAFPMAAPLTESHLPIPALIGIAVATIAVLLFLILKVRIHAFPALILISIITGIVAGIPLADLVSTLTDGLASTLSTVALLVGLGAILGRIVEVSGGAQVLADTMLRKFGEKRAPLALSVASLFYAFPIFLDAGYIVMLPIIYTVARRLGGPFMLYALPSLGSFVMMHTLAPPHPGPVAATTGLNADIGLVLMVALLVGLPTWYVAGYRLSLVLARRYPNMPVPQILGEPTEVAEQDRPRFSTVLLLLVLPLLLIFMNTGLTTLESIGIIDGDGLWYDIPVLLGETWVALLITTLLAMLLLITRKHNTDSSALQDVVDNALAPVCSIILITGAGGMFGEVLTATGIGNAVASSLNEAGLPLMLTGFVIAVVMRVAQGSATVAATTAGALMAPVVSMDPTLTSLELAIITVGTAAGSITFSHVNDSAFWLIGRFLGLDTKKTFKLWTTICTAIGFMSFGLAYLLLLLVG